jgi:hypothetical protein
MKGEASQKVSVADKFPEFKTLAPVWNRSPEHPSHSNWAADWRIWGLIPCRGKISLSSPKYPDRLGTHSASYSMGALSHWIKLPEREKDS